MKINKALNLVCPIDAESGVVYVHSMPISREVFERYFLVISKTFVSLFTESLNTVAGPRVAAMLLKQTAMSMGVWDGEAGVANGLMAEIRRLSNVLVPTETGWRHVPLYDALAKGYVDEQDVDEAENAIVFFTCISRMNTRKEAAALVIGMGELWGTQTTSLSTTEFAASLETSTAAETSPQEAKQSSLPG